MDNLNLYDGQEEGKQKCFLEIFVIHCQSKKITVLLLLLTVLGNQYVSFYYGSIKRHG